MLFYSQYYQRYGVRQPGQMMTPRMPPLSVLELPQKSIFHYVGHDSLDEGPDSDEYLFRHITKPIQMIHVRKLLEFRGNPRFMTVPIDQEIRTYHSKNRRYRWNRSPNVLASLRDPTTPLVVNYGYLGRLYRYQRAMATEYNRWWNINATVWKTIAQMAPESEHQHFIELGLPKVLPGQTDLRIASECMVEGDLAQFASSQLVTVMESINESPLRYATEAAAMEALNQRTIKIFQTPESMMLLELWKWLGPNREKSLIDVVPAQVYDRINLIFTESGRWMVINLGMLNSWRVATPEEQEKNPELAQTSKKGLVATMIQKRMLQMVMALFSVRTDASPEVKAVVQAELGAAEQNETEQGEQDHVASQVELKHQLVAKSVTATLPAGKGQELTQVKPQSTPSAITVAVPEVVNAGVKSKSAPVDERKLTETIDKDLAQLEVISKAQQQEADAALDARIAETTERTPEGSVMEICQRLAEEGQLSAAEMRRYEALSKKYHEIVAPDGKQTLKDYIVIKPEETQIKESRAIKDIPTVTDKSMLKSSLHDFDSRYIKEVFHRDVASMVMAIQHAGVCVTEYETERHDLITGSFDAYSVRVTPVEGAASTLRFKLPVLEADGTYMANGVKYHIRKQWGDLPIRKIAPDRVKLTSYYGTIWITRSDKKVDNYGEWLRNSVMAKGLDEQDTTITDLHPLDVFDSSFKSPRLYSILAMGFKSFRCGTWQFMLDHREREKYFGKDALRAERTRTPGVVMAANSQGDVLMAGFNDTIYHVSADGQTQAYVSAEELFNLPMDRAPIDFVTIKIFNRNLPVAFVLGYMLGLDGLCRLLGVQPRIVPAGTRMKLERDEYPIIFEDESWVFSRKDKFATLILAGLNDFHHSLRDYGSHQFNKKGVYLNLLENNGPSMRYIREIEQVFRMFIDPITMELLQAREEPTTFRGLVMKAVSLLENDQHEDEFDRRFMRLKGNERMAGAVYSELINSLRAHNGRAAKSKYPIELSPFKVWQAIQEDPSKGLVKDINPIQNLKEKEAMTFGGTGGRSGRSMVKRTRKYHVSEKGITSEATVDSGDVGINTYTSADPQLTSLRGLTKPYVDGETGATALFSTSALISPGADRDD